MTDAQQSIYQMITNTILATDTNRPLLVAINGKDASGKTMMADLLADYLKNQTARPVVRISVDDFMNERAVRYTPSESAARSCYEYTFNFTGFVERTLKPLRSSGPWTYTEKLFDHATDTPAQSPEKSATSQTIVIIDGVFLYKRDLRDYWDIKILLETDDDVVIERGAKRDEMRLGSYEVAKQKYIDRYIASQTIYFNEEQPANVADIIINNNNVDSPYQVC